MDRRQAAKEILSAVVVLGSQKPTSMVPMRAQGESLALHLLLLHPNGVPPGELCRAMGVSSARIAVIFASLERKGFVTRQAESEDRRRIRVALTPAGQQRAEEEDACIIAHVEQCLSVLDDEEIQCCIRVLHKLEALHHRQSKETIC